MKKLFSWKYSDNANAFGLFLLRLTMGGLMIPNGYNKLTSFASQSSTFVDPFHIGPATSMALLIFAEFFCAIFVLIGFMTRLACIPLIIAMTVAVVVGHKGDIFGEGGHAALFLGGFLALLFTGPGKFSMDKLVGK